MAIVGVMGIMKLSINSLTVMIPSFIVIIGSAYGMHSSQGFEENIHLKNAVSRTVHEERVPVLLSALTTMAGFSSYILLDLKAFQEMGIFSSVQESSSLRFSQLSCSRDLCLQEKL